MSDQDLADQHKNIEIERVSNNSRHTQGALAARSQEHEQQYEEHSVEIESSLIERPERWDDDHRGDGDDDDDGNDQAKSRRQHQQQQKKEKKLRETNSKVQSINNSSASEGQLSMTLNIAVKAEANANNAGGHHGLPNIVDNDKTENDHDRHKALSQRRFSRSESNVSDIFGDIEFDKTNEQEPRRDTVAELNLLETKANRDSDNEVAEWSHYDSTREGEKDGHEKENSTKNSQFINVETLVHPLPAFSDKSSSQT
ncbi:hypothetical protein RFI_08095 [Reticulomyxa filosa]|uniref:Uncharacterized protein n=1 Tax=Reticulomyxa filosa TaxID=46433 RepID=X6NUU2_RETFI|nr:hypothetical protein RFI_08095 [Reticulomyxa filosa]|eukprot:ETO29032.1 hypothetical protein RFI_08095 [Reticulomyxa filosa]